MARNHRHCAMRQARPDPPAGEGPPGARTVRPRKHAQSRAQPDLFHQRSPMRRPGTYESITPGPNTQAAPPVLYVGYVRHPDAAPMQGLSARFSRGPRGPSRDDRRVHRRRRGRLARGVASRSTPAGRIPSLVRSATPPFPHPPRSRGFARDISREQSLPDLSRLTRDALRPAPPLPSLSQRATPGYRHQALRRPVFEAPGGRGLPREDQARDQGRVGPLGRLLLSVGGRPDASQPPGEGLRPRRCRRTKRPGGLSVQDSPRQVRVVA